MLFCVSAARFPQTIVIAATILKRTDQPGSPGMLLAASPAIAPLISDKPYKKIRPNMEKLAAFTATDIKAVIEVGAPS